MGRIRIVNLTKPFLLFFLLIVSSTCRAGTVELVQDQFTESYINEVKISGAVRAGVMFQSNARSVIPEDLFISLGKTGNRHSQPGNLF